jgi:phage tail-like protein
MPSRPGDPHLGFNFLVDLGDGDSTTPQAMFSEVTGLGSAIEVVEYRLGGDPTSATRKLPGRRTFSNVTLKRGITTNLSLWQWISQEPPDRRDVTIVLLNERREPAIRFRLAGAFPVKVSAPDLNSRSSEVAIESVELCHEGLQVDAD